MSNISLGGPTKLFVIISLLFENRSLPPFRHQASYTVELYRLLIDFYLVLSQLHLYIELNSLPILFIKVCIIVPRLTEMVGHSR